MYSVERYNLCVYVHVMCIVMGAKHETMCSQKSLFLNEIINCDERRMNYANSAAYWRNMEGIAHFLLLKRAIQDAQQRGRYTPKF